MNTHKMKSHRNADTQPSNREPQQNYRLGKVSNELLGGLKQVLRALPHPQFLNWYKIFSWLFGSHDNPLTLSFKENKWRIHHTFICFTVMIQ